MTGRPRGGVGGKRGPEPSWAAGGRGTYTEVTPTWPAPSPLSQPHGMVHTEKQKEENKYKSQGGRGRGGIWRCQVGERVLGGGAGQERLKFQVRGRP